MGFQLINWLIQAFSVGVSSAVSQLPADPFIPNPAVAGAVSSVVGYASYLLPIHEAVTLMGAVAACALIWYGVSIAFRWAKVIGQ